ncbi:Ankyrin repeat and KH domain-containing protein mask, partial [Gryllus bimaculatus]
FARSYLRQVTTWRAARSAASAVAAVIPTCQGVPFKCADDAELVDTAPSSLLCTVSTFGMASTERESSQPDSTADDWGNSEFLSSMNLCDEPDKACKHERKQSCTHDRRGWRHAICTAAQKGDVADAKRLLATECACAPHEADARTAKERALLNACVYGHTDLLRLLLAHGVNVDAQLENGMTGLLYAAARNRVQCVEVLLDHGADLHHVGPYGSTALHWAADKGAAECVRVLLERGANSTLPAYYGYTPLYCAAKGYPLFDLHRPYSQVRRNPSIDYLECVRIFCRHEYITSVPEKEKNDALRAAIEKRNEEITQFLLDENIADVSYKTIDGETVLHVAALCGNVEIIRALLKAGADVNCRENKGKTPLHLVGSSICAQELIRWGADVRAQDFDGWAAVHVSAFCASDDEIRVLVEAGADVGGCVHDEREWRRKMRWVALGGEVAEVERLLARECACAPHTAFARRLKESVLLVASVRGHADLVRFLLQLGVHVDAQLDRVTGLLYAAAFNRVQCVEVLLDHGADLHHVGPYGSTALHWAADKGAAECVRVLLERGANFTAEDKNRALPLYCAVKGYGSAFERRHLRDTCTRSRRNPSCDYLESVRVLCRPEYITRVPQQTKNFALCAAIEKGNVEITQYLLDENIADLSYTTIEGETVMHIAAFYSNVENIRALVMAGADVNCRENKGRTPLHFVRSSSCAEELIRWGADVLAQDFEGLAAVHYASARQSEDLIRILVAAGADVAAECIYGETALHICAHLSHLACVTLLLDLGADINAKTVEGMTPLHYTAQTKNLSCTQNWYEGACRQRPAGLDGAALGGARGLDERLQYLLARGWACRSRTAAGRRRCTWPCGEGNARCRGGAGAAARAE